MRAFVPYMKCEVKYTCRPPSLERISRMVSRMRSSYSGVRLKLKSPTSRMKRRNVSGLLLLLSQRGPWRRGVVQQNRTIQLAQVVRR